MLHGRPVERCSGRGLALLFSCYPLARRCRRTRLRAEPTSALAAGGGLLVIALTMVSARRFAETSWPLVDGHPGILAALDFFSCLPVLSRSTRGERSSQQTNDRERSRWPRAPGSLARVGCPSVATRRRGSGCHRPTVQGLSGERSCPLPVARHARPGDTAALAPSPWRPRLCRVTGRHARRHGGRAGVGIAAAALVVALPAVVGTRRL